MLNGVKSISGKAKRLVREVIDAQESVIIFRRYIDARIDQLTGDPVNTSGNDYVDYSIAATVSDADDYSSKVDREWTGDLFKRLKIYVFDGLFVPTNTDVVFVDYNGGVFPYRIFNMRRFGSRWQIEVERIDRAAD